ncbi:hypothetical protein A2U01_0108371, partial [Trifolium medium]|nr:hypothetical protein [Trifolium medium]MCI87090.1 hypothetical protein [Trifolium medium]
MTGGGG